MNRWSIGIKGGLWGGLALAAFSILFRLAGYGGSIFEFIGGIVLFSRIIYVLQRSFKQKNQGFMNYTQGVRVGITSALVASFVGNIVYCLCLYYLPAMRKKEVQTVISSLQPHGLPNQEAIAPFLYHMNEGRGSNVWYSTFLENVVYWSIGGIILSLVITTFTKKSKAIKLI